MMAPCESKSVTLSALAAIALVILTVVSLDAQFEQILVNDPRPIEKIVEAIEVRCRCVITYEDPQYTAAQLVDWTSKRKDGKTEPKLWGPPQVIFSFNYDLGAANQGIKEVARNVEFALGQFNSSRNDGVSFRLTRSSSSMMHVIPSAGSILNTPVKGVLKQGTAFEVIRSIVNAVSRVQGTKIGIFGMEQLLNRTEVSLQSDSGTAEQLLMSLWPSISKEFTLSWKLLYDGGKHFYVLNVVAVLVPPDLRQ